MREIKFRAWEERQKKMWSMFAVSYDGALLGWHGIKKAWTKYEAPAGRKLVLMQFTGLKDKNGKEIYEGDVLRDTNDQRFRDRRGDGITVVFWNAAGFEIYENWDERNNRPEGVRFGYWVPEAMSNVEILGNIYENPELLK